MSGGSFNYLFGAMEDGLTERRDSLRDMGEAVSALAPGSAAAVSYRRLNALCEAVDAEARRLAPLARAVEWWQSSDTSKADALVAVALVAAPAAMSIADIEERAAQLMREMHALHVAAAGGAQ